MQTVILTREMGVQVDGCPRWMTAEASTQTTQAAPPLHSPDEEEVDMDVSFEAPSDDDIDWEPNECDITQVEEDAAMDLDLEEPER